MLNNFIIFLLILTNFLVADITTAHQIRKANRNIQQGNYPTARAIYNNLPNNNFKIIFNKGYLESASRNFQEAQNYYQLITTSDKYPAKVKAKTLFNLANNFLTQTKIKEAINCYRQALLLDPGNKKIIQNLEIANNLKISQQQDNNENSDKDNNNQNTDKKADNNQDNNGKNNEDINEEKKNAERILDSFKDDELKALKTIINKQELDYDVEQDW